MMQDKEMPQAGGAQPELLFSTGQSDGSTAQVTVAVPLFNYGRFVLEAFESIRAQTLSALDLVVVDDCSTDDSLTVARSWLESHSNRFGRAELLRNARNSGLARTRNLAFRRAATEFVFPLDPDNSLYPSCLEKLHRSLQSSRAAFAYCLLERFGDQSALGENCLMHVRPWNPAELSGGNWIDAMVLWRKANWQQLGGYSESMPRPGWEDYDLWFKLARAKGYGLQVMQILARYRVHPASMLRTLTDREDSRAALRAHIQTTYPEFFVPGNAAQGGGSRLQEPHAESF